MKIVLEAKESTINLCDYEVYFPVIENMWVIPKNHRFYSMYKYNPDTGKEIAEEDPNTWYPQAIKDMVLLDSTEYSLDMINNKISVLYEGPMDTMYVLIDYEERQCQNCPNRIIGAFDEGFCYISGCRKSKTSSCDTTEKNILKYGNAYGKKEDDNNSNTELKGKQLNNQVIAWNSDEHFTEGKRYECTNPNHNMVDVIDDHGKTVTIELEDKDFTFILCPRDIVLKEFIEDKVHKPLEEKLDDLIMKYRIRLTTLYEELDKTKEDDIFVKTELLETIISELGMIKNSKEQVKLKAGDYVEGYEPYGQKEAYIRGTIQSIKYNEDGTILRCDIQCDDAWNGTRSNGLNPRKEINKIERDPDWWQNTDRFIREKETVEHEFKIYNQKKAFIQLYYSMTPSQIDDFNRKYSELKLRKDISPEELYCLVQTANEKELLEEMLNYIKTLF